MNKLRNNVPNGITALNLACGSVSVILALSGELTLASWFIFIAAILDFFDGFAARLLKARSDIGAQLDSLADVVSFGLAPAIILYVMISHGMGSSILAEGFNPMPLLALLVVIASAYRLARFNNEPAQQERFSGLPTPAMGLFVASLPLALLQYEENEFVTGFLGNPYILLTIGLVLAWLMVSRISMFSLKVKNLKWRGNRAIYILAGLSVLMIAFSVSRASP